jgi:hypothetical protein
MKKDVFGGDAEALYDQIFKAWLNTTLYGAKLSMGPDEAQEEETEVKDNAIDLQKALSKIFKEGAGSESGEITELPRQTPREMAKSVDGLYSEIAKVVSSSITPSVSDLTNIASGIKEAASSVVSSIPLLGTIVAGVKLIKQGIELGLLVAEACKIYQAKKDSFSLIEREALSAIQSFQKEKGAQLGKDMATTAATGVTAAVGGAAIAEAGTKLADLLMLIVIRIIRLYQIRKANEAMKKENGFTLELLRSCPTLALHLPHLDGGVDTLTLLGVLPPGWKGSDKKGIIQTALLEGYQSGKVRSTDVGWLIRPLDWNEQNSMYLPPDESGLGGAASGAAQAATKQHNPWSREFERIRYMLEKTDKYLYAQNWRLYKKKDPKPLYEPKPTGFMDKFKEEAKSKLQNAFKDCLPQDSVLPPIG